MSAAFNKYPELVVRTYRFWTVSVFSNQCQLGRCYIFLNREGAFHWDDEEITEEERDELVLILRALKRALQQLFSPSNFNTSDQGNEWRHCHTHLIPRYDSPRKFMGYTFTDPSPGRNLAQYDRAFVTPEYIRDGLKDRLRELLPSTIEA